MPDPGSWLLRPPPEDAQTLLFGFPYAGGGASLYRQWPNQIGDAWFGALQPPGREHRFREPPVRTHAEFTESLVEYLARFADRKFAFFGHCGGVPLALSTTLALQDRGMPLPARIFASGWGPPHERLYGRLNFVDLATADLGAEVGALFDKLGVPVREDFVEVAAQVLRVDLELHRPHLHDATRFLPAPVTVLGWTDDDVVPPAEVCRGWEEVAETRYEVLDGEHFAFTRCPPHLVDLLTRDMTDVRPPPSTRADAVPNNPLETTPEVIP
ncbi:thioesterase II family protein [Saccharopolyspora shandongensis]|uniref:thioesterase II family protein n=1 Tax=Saccharopolyspora shandongensis TaxID=418495 RepID=UPI0033C19FBF